MASPVELLSTVHRWKSTVDFPPPLAMATAPPFFATQLLMNTVSFTPQLARPSNDRSHAVNDRSAPSPLGSSANGTFGINGGRLFLRLLYSIPTHQTQDECRCTIYARYNVGFTLEFVKSAGARTVVRTIYCWPACVDASALLPQPQGALVRKRSSVANLLSVVASLYQLRCDFLCFVYLAAMRKALAIVAASEPASSGWIPMAHVRNAAPLQQTVTLSTQREAPRQDMELPSSQQNAARATLNRNN